MNLKEVHSQVVNELNKKGVEKFCEDHDLKSKQHKDYDNLFLFTYGMLGDFKDPVRRFCRGVILDGDDNWSIVNMTYHKFFNYKEDLAAPIDWRSVKVCEKLDGSLMQFYHYDGAWHVATSGTPDAYTNMNGFNKVFKDFFWETWFDLDYSFPKDTNKCFAFELVSKYNRIIVEYCKPNIVLHGVRNKYTLEEEDAETYAKLMGWDYAETYELKSLKEMEEFVNLRSPTENEGVVLVDKNFNRVKIKSEEYVKWHHLIDRTSDKAFVEIVMDGGVPEVLAYFPEYQEDFDAILEKYNSLAEKIESEYKKYKDIEEQKEFALNVKELPYSGLLFMKRAGKIDDMKEGLAKMNVKKLMQLMGLR